MAGNLEEVGRSGLLYSGGIIHDEFSQPLRGARGRRLFREMADNEPVIGGIILALVQMMMRLNWHFEVPNKEADDDDDEIEEFVQQCFEDMSDDWQDTLYSILQMIIYGWSYLEIVYKIRDGDHKSPQRRSKYDDGKIGWRKWAERSQDSLLRWELDDAGGMRGMVQTVYGDFTQNKPVKHTDLSAKDARNQISPGGQVGTFFIPIEKALLFRTSSARNNPEGRSLLRNAYRPYWFKKRIEEIEAIGIERDLAGLPVGWVSPEYFSPSATQDQKILMAQVQNIVTGIKRNEMEGVVFPLLYNDKGHKLIDLELMNSGGQRQFDTDKVIGRKSQEIAMTFLADFIMLGHENVGSQSLGDSKIDLWKLSIEGLAKSIASVVNHFAVPRLLKLNGMDTENMPELVYGDVSAQDVSALGTFIKAMSDAGIIVPDMRLEEYIRDMVKLPPIDEESREDMGVDVALTPEEMQAYVDAGAVPPATKKIPKAEAKANQLGDQPMPKVKPGTKVEQNAKQDAAKPGAKNTKPGTKPAEEKKPPLVRPR
jgi:hypothetical protein